MLKSFIAAIAVGCFPVFAAEQSQLDQHQRCPNTPGAYRVLFIGDSITLHGTSKGIAQSLGWTHVSGMAASAPGKDYVSGLVTRISNKRKQKVVACFHTYGGSGKARERLDAMDKVSSTNPDLVIVQLGEHEKEADGEQALSDAYSGLLRASKAFPNNPIVLAVGPWSGAMKSPTGEYAGWAGVVDATMSRKAAELKVPYSSVRDISFIAETKGWGSSDGVKWHPNDIGHSLYAERIYRMYLGAEAARLNTRTGS